MATTEKIDVAGPRMKPRFHVISAESSPRATFSGKPINVSSMPPRNVPNAAVAFIEKARTAYTTPSRRMPVSSSCSSITSASMESVLALRIGATSAETVA